MKTLFVSFSIAVILHSVCSLSDICDNVCSCNENETPKNTRIMDCSNAALHVVPAVDNWTKDVTTLELSFNNIKILDVQLTHDTLTTLQLDNNEIENVHPDVFGGLRRLLFLDLSHNNIAELEGNTFYGLEQLLSLNLSNNELKSITTGLFNDLVNLKELYISNNPIFHVEKINFVRVLNLESLVISGIQAYSLPSDIFSPLDSLHHLDISLNDFHKIPTDALRSAKNLRHLILSDNPITELDSNSFRKLESLETLELNFMKELTTISTGTFTWLTNLKSLDIKGNHKLRLISPDAFKDLFNSTSPFVLRNIDLSMNNLATLTVKIPCNLMQTLNLQRNPWACDCRMKWLRKCYIPEIYAAGLRCSSPRKFKDVLFVTIPEEDFQCAVQEQSYISEDIHHNRIMRTISLAFGTFFLIILAFLIILTIKWRNLRNWWRNKKRGPGAVYYVRAQPYPIEG